LEGRPEIIAVSTSIFARRDPSLHGTRPRGQLAKAQSQKLVQAIYNLKSSEFQESVYDGA